MQEGDSFPEQMIMEANIKEAGPGVQSREYSRKNSTCHKESSAVLIEPQSLIKRKQLRRCRNIRCRSYRLAVPREGTRAGAQTGSMTVEDTKNAVPEAERSWVTGSHP